MEYFKYSNSRELALKATNYKNEPAAQFFKNITYKKIVVPPRVQFGNGTLRKIHQKILFPYIIPGDILNLVIANTYK